MRTGKTFFQKRIVFLCSIILICLCLCLSIATAGESFVLDGFEYWDSPSNHGWQSSDYAYPLMGYGVGYGNLSTQIDQAEGSRVLVVRCTPTVFNRLQPYCLANYNLLDPDTGKAPEGIGFSYKMKAPIGVESFTQLRCCLLVKTRENVWLWLSYLPIEGKDVQDLGNFSSMIPPPPSQAFSPLTPTLSPRGEGVEMTSPASRGVNDYPPSGLVDSPFRCLGYPAGREIQDSTWHCVVRDLQKDLDQAVEEGFLSAPQHLEGVYGIAFSGNEYSVDEVTFCDDLSRYKNHHPFVWNPGPQFATLFEPFNLILYASDAEKTKLSFDIQVGGWGIHGMPGNEMFSLKELGTDPDDPCVVQDFSLQRALLSFTPQYFEDLIVTVTVSDGYTSDITMFPLSVVNYPVQNHPPMIQRSGMLSRFVAHVGETFTYRVKVFDKDYDQLTFSATINGLPSYQFGPWQEPLIDPQTGLIQITPQFEGFFKITVTVRNTKGAIGQTTWDLTVANRGGWLNHPPVRVVNVPSPQMVRAGERYIVATNFVDPDGDDLYYSTNIGTVTPEGAYSFLTYFPGQYRISIIAYDLYGGKTYQDFLIDVQPWWSY